MEETKDKLNGAKWMNYTRLNMRLSALGFKAHKQDLAKANDVQ